MNEEERKIVRKVVGEILWVSLMTRPDLAFETTTTATIKDFQKIDWLETDRMLADILTKKGGDSWWIKNVFSRNVV